MKSKVFRRLRVLTFSGWLLAGGVAAVGQTQPSQDQAPHAWRKADATAADNTAASNGASATPADPQSAPADAAPVAQPNASQAPQSWPDPQQQAQAQEPQAQQSQAGPGPDAQQPAPPPPAGMQGGYPAQPQYNQGQYNQGPYNQPQYGPQAPYNPQAPYYPGASYGNYKIPATLTITPGTYITVRVNGWLSSDRNQPGDAFTATLAEPLIVNGVVVAQRGQTVGGVVTEAKKAGRVEGTSRLAVKLTDITLADGQKVNLQTSMTTRRGDTSVGRDAAAIGGTTALGAAVGAGADWGRGAAIGAGAGAAAGILGVLLTRGRPTVIYPETALTFRVDAPATIDTTHAPQAFRYADQSDYGGPAYGQGAPPARMAGPCYGCGAPGPAPYGAPAPYYGPSYYPYYSPYPYYWGPGFSFYIGRGFYYPRYYAGGLWFRRR